MKRNILIIVCILILFFPPLIFGQGFTGPGSFGSTGASGPVMASQPATIAEATRLPRDSWVVLSGNIINALPGRNYYTFRDSSGEIAVEIGTKHWRGLSVGVTDRVVIYGEVKANRGLVHIKVQAITGDGRVNVRQGQPVTIVQPISIMEARNLAHDSFVVLQGNILNFQSRNNYTFRDSSGEITVDIGSKQWRGLTVGAGDRVEIYGEVKISRGLVHIKVHAIRRI